MWPWIVAGVTAAGLLVYKIASASEEPTPKPTPKPGPFKPVVPSKPVAPARSQGTAQPHTVPGGHFTYTGAQAAPDKLQAAATALAAGDPTLKQNEQLVRNFPDAAGPR